MLRTVLIAALLIFPCAARARGKTDREADNLRGPVRSMRIEEADITHHDGVAVEGPRKTRHVFTYDAEGNNTEHAFYRPDGVLSHTIKYLYDNGRRVASEHYDRKGEIKRRSVLSYDAAGKLRAVMTYDAEGKLAGRMVYDRASDGESYDMRVYDEAGKLTHRQLVTRSHDSTRAEEIDHDGEQVSGRLVWVQNGDGSMREEVEYAADGSVKVAASYVDDLPRATVYGPGGAVKQRTYFTLDAQDAYGNWTKRTQWVVEAGRPARAAGVFYRAVTHF